MTRYGEIDANNGGKQDVLVANLRSDTVTKPCRAMRQAMFEADVGDDVCGEDPTVNKLQKVTADLLGKEAAIFVPSGTMGNLISIMNHCNIRGCEIYIGEDSHIALHEQGGPAQIAGVTICTLPNNPDGTFDLEALKLKLRDPLDPHSPISKMVAVENAFNGRVIPQDWLNKLVAFAKEHKLKLHMDGARLWNAVTATKIPVKEMVAGFDSVTFCLSKGLGAPVGAILCGDEEFINSARRYRKVLGGGMRQVGVLAAAGFVALENRSRLHLDHKKTVAIMQAINCVGSKIISVDPTSVQTNMIFIHVVESPGVDEYSFAKRLHVVLDDNDDDKTIVLAYTVWPGQVRLVLHLDITDEMVDAVIRKLVYVIRKVDPSTTKSNKFNNDA